MRFNYAWIFVAESLKKNWKTHYTVNYGRNVVVESLVFRCFAGTPWQNILGFWLNFGEFWDIDLGNLEGFQQVQNLENILTPRCQNFVSKWIILRVGWRRKLKMIKHSYTNQRVIVTRSSKINNCHVIFNSCAKRNCLRNYFPSKNSKVNLGGTHDLNDREKYGSKREKVIGVMTSTMISKNDFFDVDCHNFFVRPSYELKIKLE